MTEPREDNSKLAAENAADAESPDEVKIDIEEVDSAPLEPGAESLRLPEPAELDSVLRSVSIKELQLFCRTGIRSETIIRDPSSLALGPAVLHPYVSGQKFRGPYPLVFNRTSTGLEVDLLSDIIDRLAAVLEGGGDEIEIQKRAFYQFEQKLVEAVTGDEIVDFHPLFEDLTRALIKSVNGKEERRQAFSRAFDELGEVIHEDSRLVPCSSLGIRGLMTEHVRSELRQRTSGFKEEIDWLASALNDLLRVEEDDSSTGRSAERLEHTVGGSYKKDFDFSSFSHLLEDAPHGPAIGPERKKRIEATFTKLSILSRELFDSDAMTVAESTEQIEKELEIRKNRFTDLVRSIQVARLEVENRYHPERHDQLFDSFGADSLEPSQRRMFPPVLAHIHLSADSSENNLDSVSLLSILQTPWPVRVLVTYETAFTAEGNLTPGALLASSAISLGSIFAQQSCLSAADFILVGLAGGASYAGNALFTVFSGSGSTHPDLSQFLRAAVASDARAVPTFRYDPQAGTDWADRFSASDNEQPGCTWPRARFKIEDQASQEGSVTLSVTGADFMGSDSRFSDHFLPVSPSVEDEQIRPLEDFLTLSETERHDVVPFVWMNDSEGRLIRTVVSPLIVQATTVLAARWRMIQEWSGEQSSIADRRLAAARDEMKAEKEAAIGAVTKEFEGKMSESTETLARQIVENIAAGLLGVQASPSVGAISTRPARVEQAEPSAIVSDVSESDTSAEDDDEDIPLPLDDPYIDTPLCTTCNECTNLNGLMFAYNDDKQAIIKDATAGTYQEIVLSAEKCPVRIIHPGKPLNPDEQDLEEWIERAKPFL